MSRKIRELTLEEQKKAIKLYNKGIKKADISKELKIDYRNLKNFFDNNNMPNKKIGIPLEHYETIFKLYEAGLTLQQIHEQYYPEFSTDQINYICRERGITRSRGKKSILNHEYFNKIDSQEKAYWLGFLFADGAVRKEKNKGDSWSVTFGLMKEDKYIVEQFVKDVESSLSVKEYINNTGFQRRDGRPHIECRITLYSKELVHTLMRHGIVENKSLLLDKIPNIPEELYRHFVRGFFDGNGSITHSWDKRHIRREPKILFYSTHKFCEKIQAKICEQLGTFQGTITDQKKESVSLFAFHRFEDVIAIYNYFYNDLDDENHYCKRKKEKMEELISEYRDNYVA